MPVLSWDLGVRHSSYSTKLVHLGDAEARQAPEGGWVEGYPLGARFIRPINGYADANGNGIIETSEVQLGNMPVYAGQSIPPRSLVLSTVVGLFQRRLRISALVERRTGFTQVNQMKFVQCVLSRCRASVDPSTPLGEQAEAAVVGRTGTAPGTQAYFTFVEPGDFTRLREVTAELDLPASAVRLLRARSATLSLSARNIALWTRFSGPDPESAAVNGVSGGVASGIPQARAWSVRIHVGF